MGKSGHKEGMQECKIKHSEINTEQTIRSSKQEIQPQKCFPLKRVNAKQHKGKRKESRGKTEGRQNKGQRNGQAK